MKERQRVERLLAKKDPIGLLVMSLLILIGGTVLTFVFGLFWLLWYAIIGGMIVSFNAFVVNRRLDSLAEKHQAERDSRAQPVKIEEFIE